MCVLIWTMTMVTLQRSDFFLPLQDRHVGMSPEDEEVILALHLALLVGVVNLTKIAKFLKF